MINDVNETSSPSSSLLPPFFLRGIIFNNAFLVVGPPPSISPNILRAKIDSGIVLIGGRGKGYYNVAPFQQ